MLWLIRLTKCQGCVLSVKAFEVEIKIRMVKRTKYKMLRVVHECCATLQAKTFYYHMHAPALFALSVHVLTF